MYKLFMEFENPTEEYLGIKRSVQGLAHTMMATPTIVTQTMQMMQCLGQSFMVRISL